LSSEDKREGGERREKALSHSCIASGTHSTWCC
jgi:hypothetical protein